MSDEQRTLLKQDLVDLLRKPEHVVIGDMTISEPLVLSGDVFDHRVQIRDVVFNHEVDFSDTRFHRGLDLSGCTFRAGLKLNDARIEGPLRLDRVVVRPAPQGVERDGDGDGSQSLREENGEPEVVADLTNLRVWGNLSLTSACVDGTLECCYADIEDELRLDGSHVRGDLNLRLSKIGEVFARMRKAEREEDGNSGGIQPRPFDCSGGIDLTSARVAGDLRLIGSHIGKLVLQAATVNGNLLCRGSEDTLGTVLHHGAWLVGARIRGAVDFSGATIKEGLNLQGSKLEGSLHLRALKPLNGEDRPCRIFGKLSMLGARVEGTVDFAGAQLRGDALLQNLRVGQNVLTSSRCGISPRVEGFIDLSGARVSGNVELRGLTLAGKLDVCNAAIGGRFVVMYDLHAFNDASRWCMVRSRIEGGIVADLATIGKEVMILGTTTGPDRSSRCADEIDSLGEIQPSNLSFSGAKVKGDLLLHSRAAVDDLLLLVRDDEKQADSGQRTKVLAEARRARTEVAGDLTLARAEVSGDVVLDGAVVRGELSLRNTVVLANLKCRPLVLEGHERGTVSAASAVLGALTAQGDVDLSGLEVVGDLSLDYAKIDGRLGLVTARPALAGGDGTDAIARIGGTIRLNAAAISEVIMSGNNFKGHALASEETYRGASAEVRCVLERAEFGRLDIREPFPGKLDLTNLKVGSWEEHEYEGFYQTVLSRSEPFNKRSYLSIESDLRNQGRDRLADDVHVAMRRRERVAKPRFGRLLEWALLDKTIAYGTRSKDLFVVMVLLFLVSVGVFSDPKMVEYELTHLSHQPAQVAGWQQVELQQPAPANWSVFDAVMLATRLHVPIVSLGIDDVARPSGPLWVRVYSLCIVAFSWIAWPLFLASASGLLRKRS